MGNRAAVVANTGSNPLIWVDMPTGKVSLVPMSYPVSALHAVNGNPVVLVSSEPSAFWLVSQTAGGPSMTYVSGLERRPMSDSFGIVSGTSAVIAFLWPLFWSLSHSRWRRPPALRWLSALAMKWVCELQLLR